MNGISLSQPKLRLVELPIALRAEACILSWERADCHWLINPAHVLHMRAVEYNTNSVRYVWRGTLLQLITDACLHVHLPLEETARRLLESPAELRPELNTSDRGSRGIRIRGR